MPAAIGKKEKHSNLLNCKGFRLVLILEENGTKCLINNCLLINTKVSINKQGQIKNFHGIT
jgi:hypothetical protein